MHKDGVPPGGTASFRSAVESDSTSNQVAGAVVVERIATMDLAAQLARARLSIAVVHHFVTCYNQGRMSEHEAVERNYELVAHQLPALTRVAVCVSSRVPCPSFPRPSRHMLRSVSHLVSSSSTCVPTSQRLAWVTHEAGTRCSSVVA